MKVLPIYKQIEDEIISNIDDNTYLSNQKLPSEREYAEKYGPLTIDDAAVSSEKLWKWSQQPFPWEREGA